MKNHKPLAISHKLLTIGWLYPELMSTYGDRGNILVLQKRAAWRGIETKIVPISDETNIPELIKIDLIFGGGAQDLEQEIVMADLKKGKGDKLKQLIEEEVPALFVCGSPQLMGRFYEPAKGKRIDGLSIFDMETTHPGELDNRLIGNVAAEILWENLGQPNTGGFRAQSIIFGFENHGGRTSLGKHAKPFAKVIKGNGNNGEDGTEGVVYKNAIGCYFHGPLLPKNPVIADHLLTRSLEVKYKQTILLEPLDDSLESQSRSAIAKKLGVNI